MKPVQVDYKDIAEQLKNQVGELQLQLAMETTVKNEVIKYAESLEKALEQNGIKIENEKDNAK